MITLLARALARLPLPLLHGLGGLLGVAAYLVSPKYRRPLRENVALAGYHGEQFALAVAIESGKAVLEMLAVWLRPQAEVLRWVREVRGAEHLVDAEGRGRGVMVVTPHVGCFELIAQWISSRGPMTVLYRPPRMRVLEPIMLAGRSRANLKSTTTDARGVRALLKALRAGEAIGMLPDQVPSRGEGEWTAFFGRPAYTMTLATRLAEATGATLLPICAERLSWGRGYRLHVAPMPERDAGESGTRWMNRMMETMIRRCPEQYFWAYNRYKVPAGVKAPTGLNA